MKVWRRPRVTLLTRMLIRVTRMRDELYRRALQIRSHHHVVNRLDWRMRLLDQLDREEEARAAALEREGE